jgi:uncharacterized membrane protein YbhN (UPF0104 family)
MKPMQACGNLVAKRSLRLKLPSTRIALSAVLLVATVAAVAAPQLLGDRVGEALSIVNRADRNWLALSFAGFVAGFLACVCAWRAALAASGGRISLAGGAASLGVGALVNTFAPARLGDVVKIALFSRAIEGPDRVWTTGGVYAAVSAARCLTIAAFVVAASLTGALPIWPVFALCVGVAAVAAVALSSPRWRRYPRLAHLLGGFAALERSPRLAVRVLGWAFATSLARLAAVAALAAALGIPHPLLAALVICPALDLAGAVPLTPGNVGIAGGAVAVALRSRGIGVTDALAVGIAIQALETALALVAGTAAALYFARPVSPAGRWAVRFATVGLTGGLAALLGTFVLEMV